MPAPDHRLIIPFLPVLASLATMTSGLQGQLGAKGANAGVRSCERIRADIKQRFLQTYEKTMPQPLLAQLLPLLIQLGLPKDCQDKSKQGFQMFNPSSSQDAGGPLGTLGASGVIYTTSGKTRKRRETGSIVGDNNNSDESLTRSKRFVPGFPGGGSGSSTGTAGPRREVSESARMMNLLMMMSRFQKAQFANDMMSTRGNNYYGDRVSFGGGLFGDQYSGKRKKRETGLQKQEVVATDEGYKTSADSYNAKPSSRVKRFIMTEPGDLLAGGMGANPMADMMRIMMGTARDPATGKTMDFGVDAMKNMMRTSFLNTLPESARPPPGKEPGDFVKTMAPFWYFNRLKMSMNPLMRFRGRSYYVSPRTSGFVQKRNRDGTFGDAFQRYGRKKRSSDDDPDSNNNPSELISFGDVTVPLDFFKSPEPVDPVSPPITSARPLYIPVYRPYILKSNSFSPRNSRLNRPLNRFAYSRAAAANPRFTPSQSVIYSRAPAPRNPAFPPPPAAAALRTSFHGRRRRAADSNSDNGNNNDVVTIGELSIPLDFFILQEDNQVERRVPAPPQPRYYPVYVPRYTPVYRSPKQRPLPYRRTVPKRPVYRPAYKPVQRLAPTHVKRRAPTPMYKHVPTLTQRPAPITTQRPVYSHAYKQAFAQRWRQYVQKRKLQQQQRTNQVVSPANPGQPARMYPQPQPQPPAYRPPPPQPSYPAPQPLRPQQPPRQFVPLSQPNVIPPQRVRQLMPSPFIPYPPQPPQKPVPPQPPAMQSPAVARPLPTPASQPATSPLDPFIPNQPQTPPVLNSPAAPSHHNHNNHNQPQHANHHTAHHRYKRSDNSDKDNDGSSSSSSSNSNTAPLLTDLFIPFLFPRVALSPWLPPWMRQSSLPSKMQVARSPVGGAIYGDRLPWRTPATMATNPWTPPRQAPPAFTPLRSPAAPFVPPSSQRTPFVPPPQKGTPFVPPPPQRTPFVPPPPQRTPLVPSQPAPLVPSQPATFLPSANIAAQPPAPLSPVITAQPPAAAGAPVQPLDTVLPANPLQSASNPVPIFGSVPQTPLVSLPLLQQRAASPLAQGPNPYSSPNQMIPMQPNPVSPLLNSKAAAIPRAASTSSSSYRVFPPARQYYNPNNMILPPPLQQQQPQSFAPQPQPLPPHTQPAPRLVMPAPVPREAYAPIPVYQPSPQAPPSLAALPAAPAASSLLQPNAPAASYLPQPNAPAAPSLPQPNAQPGPVAGPPTPNNVFALHAPATSG